VKGDEIGRICSTEVRKGMHVGFCWGSQKERPLGIPISRSEDNIKIDLKEIGLD
jgi:hypothetical protein